MNQKTTANRMSMFHKEPRLIFPLNVCCNTSCILPKQWFIVYSELAWNTSECKMLKD